MEYTKELKESINALYYKYKNNKNTLNKSETNEVAKLLLMLTYDVDTTPDTIAKELARFCADVCRAYFDRLLTNTSLDASIIDNLLFALKNTDDGTKSQHYIQKYINAIVIIINKNPNIISECKSLKPILFIILKSLDKDDKNQEKCKNKFIALINDTKAAIYTLTYTPDDEKLIKCLGRLTVKFYSDIAPKHIDLVKSWAETNRFSLPKAKNDNSGTNTEAESTHKSTSTFDKSSENPYVSKILEARMESYYKIKDGLDIILTASLYKAKDQLSKACHNYIDSADYDEQTMLSLLRSYRSFFPISDFLKKTEEESDVIKKIIGDIDIDDITPLDFTKEDIKGIIDTIIESIDEKRSEYQRQFNQTIDIDDDDERLQIQMTVMSKRKALTKPKDFFSNLKNLLSEVSPSPNSTIHIDTSSDPTGNDVSPEIINTPANEISSDINSEDNISESETNETYSPEGTVDVPSTKPENHEIDRETLRDAIVKNLFARKYLNHNLEPISTEEILDQLPYSISQYVTTTRIKQICESDSQISSTGYGTYEYNDGKEKKPVHQTEIIISNEDIKQAIEDFLYEHKDDIFHPDGFASEDILDMLPDKISENISVEIIDDIAPKCEHVIMPSFGYYMYDNTDNPTEGNNTNSLPEAIVEEDTETDTEETADIADTITNAPDAEIEAVHIPSNTDNIHFTLNNREYYAFDWSEVLCKVCEYFIRKAPFRMARIAGVQIYHNGQLVFYRKSVPVDDYCKLTNGLQVIKISSEEDFNAIYNDISEYCQIFDEIVFY